MAGNERALLAKLRRDIASHSLLLVGKIVAMRFDSLVILAFLEFLYLMRLVVFLTGIRLLVPTYNNSLFSNIYK